MKSKWQLFSSVFQITVGVLAIGAFLVLAWNGEDLLRWTVTLLLAIAYLVLGVLGVVDYLKNKR